MGLYTPTILGGNSYLSWFYDRGAIKDQARTGTSKGLSQTINRGPIRRFLPKYAHFYVTFQSHGLSAGAWTHYVTASGVGNGLHDTQPGNLGAGFVCWLPTVCKPKSTKKLVGQSCLLFPRHSIFNEDHPGHALSTR